MGASGCREMRWEWGKVLGNGDWCGLCGDRWSGGATRENQKEGKGKFGNHPPFQKEFTVSMEKWQAMIVMWWMLKVQIICIMSIFRCKQFLYFLKWLKYLCIIGISIIGNDYYFMVKKNKVPH